MDARVPENQLPMWSHWQLPSGPLHSSYELNDLLSTERAGLWLGNAKLLQEAWQADPGIFRNLKYLAIEQRQVTPSALEVIADLESLERLYLTRITAPELTFLKKLTRLRYLCIEAAANVDSDSSFYRTDALVSVGLGTAMNTLAPLVKAYPNLRCLALQGISETKPARFENLAGIDQLQHLEYLLLMNCRAHDKRLSPLLGLPKLKAVVIGSQRWWQTSDLNQLDHAGVKLSEFLHVG